MRNQFKGNCFLCGKEVPPGHGFFQNKGHMSKEERKQFVGGGRWLIRCVDCIGKGNKIPKKDYTPNW